VAAQQTVALEARRQAAGRQSQVLPIRYCQLLSVTITIRQQLWRQAAGGQRLKMRQKSPESSAKEPVTIQKRLKTLKETQ